uniref:Rab-GAP TBC domain-containing protein n=1 Tax=Chromera velia CCMP2878 TaxID=1169474 RepID=A0A0G4GEF7_9ALVE|eukprot:Cvel_21431.t1-p1 / transcript=Cvel_21431.t1 / gene=Cvel_21431 / organism=Chromera_velia_CCMP2878 / gene_product=Ecotropic viral integration site 5 protein homolog, putative / transcript_product=Ecotropic viral integration site 5 protein homolog, putative / location=Cvel_scaffold2009:10545-21152(+) / protein_length=1363 / sequence_SO=supercontig / SO=protein_coding / is_pseudo=false
MESLPLEQRPLTWYEVSFRCIFTFQCCTLEDFLKCTLLSKQIYRILHSQRAREKTFRKGFPPPLRPYYWRVILTGDPLSHLHSRNPIGASYEELRNRKHAKADAAILRDVGRTLPEMELFKEKGGEGQKMLFNVLRAAANLETSELKGLGYCQGMNFVVGFLVSELGEQKAFEGLVALMKNETYDLFNFYSHGFARVRECACMLNELVKALMPEMHDRFQQFDDPEEHHIAVSANYYAMPWFMTLFVDSLPLPHAKAVWDLYLMHGSSILVCVALVLLYGHKAALSKLEYEETLKTLRDVPRRTSYSPEELCERVDEMRALICPRVLWCWSELFWKSACAWPSLHIYAVSRKDRERDFEGGSCPDSEDANTGPTEECRLRTPRGSRLFVYRIRTAVPRLAPPRGEEGSAVRSAVSPGSKEDAQKGSGGDATGANRGHFPLLASFCARRAVLFPTGSPSTKARAAGGATTGKSRPTRKSSGAAEESVVVSPNRTPVFPAEFFAGSSESVDAGWVASFSEFLPPEADAENEALDVDVEEEGGDDADLVSALETAMDVTPSETNFFFECESGGSPSAAIPEFTIAAPVVTGSSTASALDPGVSVPVSLGEEGCSAGVLTTPAGSESHAVGGSGGNLLNRINSSDNGSNFSSFVSGGLVVLGEGEGGAPIVSDEGKVSYIPLELFLSSSEGGTPTPAHSGAPAIKTANAPPTSSALPSGMGNLMGAAGRGVRGVQVKEKEKEKDLFADLAASAFPSVASGAPAASPPTGVPPRMAAQNQGTEGIPVAPNKPAGNEKGKQDADLFGDLDIFMKGSGDPFASARLQPSLFQSPTEQNLKARKTPQASPDTTNATPMPSPERPQSAAAKPLSLPLPLPPQPHSPSLPEQTQSTSRFRRPPPAESLFVVQVELKLPPKIPITPRSLFPPKDERFKPKPALSQRRSGSGALDRQGGDTAAAQALTVAALTGAAGIRRLTREGTAEGSQQGSRRPSAISDSDRQVGGQPAGLGAFLSSIGGKIQLLGERAAAGVPLPPGHVQGGQQELGQGGQMRGGRGMASPPPGPQAKGGAQGHGVSRARTEGPPPHTQGGHAGAPAGFVPSSASSPSGSPPAGSTTGVHSREGGASGVMTSLQRRAMDPFGALNINFSLDTARGWTQQGSEQVRAGVGAVASQLRNLVAPAGSGDPGGGLAGQRGARTSGGHAGDPTLASGRGPGPAQSSASTGGGTTTTPPVAGPPDRRGSRHDSWRGQTQGEGVRRGSSLATPPAGPGHRTASSSPETVREAQQREQPRNGHRQKENSLQVEEASPPQLIGGLMVRKEREEREMGRGANGSRASASGQGGSTVSGSSEVPPAPAQVIGMRGGGRRRVS